MLVGVILSNFFLYLYSKVEKVDIKLVFGEEVVFPSVVSDEQKKKKKLTCFRNKKDMEPFFLTLFLKNKEEPFVFLMTGICLGLFYKCISNLMDEGKMLNVLSLYFF